MVARRVRSTPVIPTARRAPHRSSNASFPSTLPSPLPSLDRNDSLSSTPILSPSPEILLEVFAGFLISLLGTVTSVPPLGIVRGNSHKKQNVNFVGPPPSYRSRDFDVFNHRLAPR
ncbi:hypothetical protein TL16_g09896 [Triparma laevis f. inornata]|uniref:Uncharacterized protein n=1 Tax=Triparma laevis f. inornata TaxID=1714386 RepID=A0A9W7BAE5_9STRA|nr:hypothetical protein TL16_g09896 [Triparma laevis f. inornata]